MADMLKKTPMPLIDPLIRVKSFDEVALGYSAEDALSESTRCLKCKNKPCVSACPVGVDIPTFIAKVAVGDLEGAYAVISEASSLPAVCGRVCPQESQCESKCIRGIKGESVSIGRLERFVADWHNSHSTPPSKLPKPLGIKVAVVGSGPSGLACAGDLARLGYSVCVYEALHTLGGVLVYGIPEFRLPKSIVAQEIENLRALGVRFETNVVIGKTLTVDELLAGGYSAVFIGSGAGLPGFMGIEGESLCGVYSANEFLTRVNLMGAGRGDSSTPIMQGGRVIVVGGGNVAMDAARTALRLGASGVSIVYRRSMKELPARLEEVEHAKEEGIEFCLLTNPTKILGYEKHEGKDGFVKAMECVRMELTEPDERGRRKPVKVEGSEFIMEADTVIMAVGTSPNPLIRSTTPSLSVNERGCIIADSEGRTTKEGVFAGGDAVTGAATVISAMGAGKRAAAAIAEYLSAKG